MSYHAVLRVASSGAALLLSVAVTVIFYIIVSLRSGALPKDDVLLFPFGDKFCDIFVKLGLIK